VSELAVSAHAVARYRSRVEPVSPQAARAAVDDLLDDAKIRATPRRWMRDATRHGDGVRFAYSPRAPRVGLILRGSTVVTVVTREMFRKPRQTRSGPERRYERKQRRDYNNRCRRRWRP
jgi:hypothetical protein